MIEHVDLYVETVGGKSKRITQFTEVLLDADSEPKQRYTGAASIDVNIQTLRGTETRRHDFEFSINARTPTEAFLNFDLELDRALPSLKQAINRQYGLGGGIVLPGGVR
jgi:hypothetical protein